MHVAVLNDRQKKILRDLGLPEDMEELNLLQQDSIQRIEFGIEYIEQKYPDDEFEYVAYSAEDLMSHSAPVVVLYSKKLGNDEDRKVLVNVYLDDDGQFFCKDNYEAIKDTDLYTDEISKFVADKYPEAKFFVYGSIDDKDYKEGDDYIMTRAAGYSTIVINNVFLNKEEAITLLKDIVAWMESYYEGAAKAVDMMVLDDSDIGDATKDNVIDNYRMTDKAIFDLESRIDRYGEFKVWGLGEGVLYDGTVR